jgi:hypothetical protein
MFLKNKIKYTFQLHRYTKLFHCSEIFLPLSVLCKYLVSTSRRHCKTKPQHCLQGLGSYAFAAVGNGAVNLLPLPFNEQARASSVHNDGCCRKTRDIVCGNRACQTVCSCHHTNRIDTRAHIAPCSHRCLNWLHLDCTGRGVYPRELKQKSS